MPCIARCQTAVQCGAFIDWWLEFCYRGCLEFLWFLSLNDIIIFFYEQNYSRTILNRMVFNSTFALYEQRTVGPLALICYLISLLYYI